MRDFLLGIHGTGLISVKAIRNGEIGFDAESVFMFAEVNAEKLYWFHDGNGLKFISRDKKQWARKFAPNVRIKDWVN